MGGDQVENDQQGVHTQNIAAVFGTNRGAGGELYLGVLERQGRAPDFTVLQMNACEQLSLFALVLVMERKHTTHSTW